MRDRLIELIQASVDGCARHWAEIIADHLLANGVIVPPCKVGNTVYRISKRYGKWQILPRNVCSMTYSIDHLGLIKWCITTTADDILGKTVFLSREEAEKKLRGDE